MVDSKTATVYVWLLSIFVFIGSLIAGPVFTGGWPAVIHSVALLFSIVGSFFLATPAVSYLVSSEPRSRRRRQYR